MEISFSKNTNPASGEAIEIKTEVVPTPVAGVTVETVNTAAPAETANTVAAPTPPVSVPAVATKPGALATANPLLLGDQLPSFADIILPRLNIVQKVGEMSNIYPHGAVVYNSNVVIYECPLKDREGNITKPGTPPLNLIVLGFRSKKFVERVEGGAKGAMVNSEDEVVRCGGTLDYKEWQQKKAAGMRLFQHYVEAVVIVEKPERIADTENAIFGYVAGGKRWALALWGMKGTAYTHAAKRFFTDRRMGCTREGGYPSMQYSLATRLDKFGENFAYVPVITPAFRTPADVLEFIRSVLAAD